MKTFFLIPLLTFLSVLGLSYSPAAPLSPSRSEPQSLTASASTSSTHNIATAQANNVLHSRTFAQVTPRRHYQPKPVATTTQPTPVPPAPIPTQAPPASDLSSTLPQATVLDFVSQVEQATFTLMNAERTKNNLPALAWNATLASVARAHSTDMAKNKYFDHTNLQGCSSACRVTNAGYPWRAVGENIYMMQGYNLSADATAQMIVNGWMNSPGHRANILGQQFTEDGVGVAQIGDSIYITADYGTLR